MLLCLRPAFDVLCETVAFTLEGQGDLYPIAKSMGYHVVWLSMTILSGFALLTIVHLLLKRIKITYGLLRCFLVLADILPSQAISRFFGYSADQFHFAGEASFLHDRPGKGFPGRNQRTPGPSPC